MPTEKNQKYPDNILMGEGKPNKNHTEFYEYEKLLKLDYGEIWGTETHNRRHKLILQKHPEVSQYLKPDKPYTLILTLVVVSIALTNCYLFKDASWPVFLMASYLIGGTLCHTLHVLLHDLTHFAGHPDITVNKFFAILCNVPSLFPSALPFGKHHADHHNFLGEEGKDPDLPLKAESDMSKRKGYKMFFWFFMVLFYAIRPVVFSKNAKPTRDEIINFLVILCTDLVILKMWGPNAILFMFISSFVSMGPHPAAAHVIAEHYEIVTGQETYDYFGPWNFFNLNLGYHIEHHDFPNCPWYNLPKVRAAAPEFYEQLPYHTSYIALIGKFLFDNNFNLFNRILRINKQA